MIRVLALACALSLMQTAAAKCVRLDLDAYRKSHAGDLDGPGSFGKLQDTVTLDCLRYVGSEMHGDKENVLIKDEYGALHRLTPGSYPGENTGQITKIDSKFIYIQQMIEKNGEWVPVMVKFNKSLNRDTGVR